MAAQNSIFASFYPTDWSEPTQSSQSNFILSLQHPARRNAGLMEKLFLPSAGALYVYRPSKRRRVLNLAVDKLESNALPGYEYVIAHLYDKYRRNLTISTIGQTGQTLSGFLACQSAFKNDPLSASKNDPPKVKKRSAIPPRYLWLSNQVS